MPGPAKAVGLPGAALAVALAAACARPAPDLAADAGVAITAVDPPDGSVDVPTNAVIRLGTSAHVDDGTVSGGDFKLHTGTLSYWLMAYYDPVDREIVVWPSAKLRDGADFELELRGEIAGREGGLIEEGRISGFTTGDGPGDVAPFPELRFEQDIRPIFLARCTSCHGGPTPIAGLGLDGAAAVAATAIGVAADGDPELARIEPARPGSSQLVYKIIDDGGTAGARMPRTLYDGEAAAPLKTAERQAIADWIAGGAVMEP